MLLTIDRFIHPSPFSRPCLCHMSYLCVWRDRGMAVTLRLCLVFVLREYLKEERMLKTNKKKTQKSAIPTGHFWLIGIQVTLLFSK